MKKHFPTYASVIATAFVIALMLFNISPQRALADIYPPCDCKQQACPSGAPSVNCPSDGSTNTAPIILPNPLGTQSDPRAIVGDVIKVVLGLVGSIALILFIYGGLMMMVSAGNSERVTKGRNTLVWAAIGLIVIFGSYTLVGFILQNVIPK